MNDPHRQIISDQLASFQGEYDNGRNRLAEIQAELKETSDRLGQEAAQISAHLTQIEGAMHACHLLLEKLPDNEASNITHFPPS